MSRHQRRFARLALIAVAVAGTLCTIPLGAQTDLDVVMRQVLERRDENWKRLQQYVLDERERVDLRGPTGATLWGERRDYTWYLRDGFFVRSPLRVNGAPVSDGDRRAFEEHFIQELTERERRRAEASGREYPASSGDPATPDVDGLIRQSRQPQFISMAYFLRFRFEAGRYAFVGHETLDGRDALKVEYYPIVLFREPRRPGAERPNDPVERETLRLMNKVSLVTLWIDPTAHQILKYTFDNVSLDFLPTQWFARVQDVKATMTMGQPFPDVWLPKTVDIALSGTLAIGQFDLQYGVEYHDYRQAEGGSKVIVPDGR